VQEAAPLAQCSSSGWLAEPRRLGWHGMRSFTWGCSSSRRHATLSGFMEQAALLMSTSQQAVRDKLHSVLCRKSWLSHTGWALAMCWAGASRTHAAWKEKKKEQSHCFSGRAHTHTLGQRF
jgi:hypothetical protein